MRIDTEIKKSNSLYETFRRNSSIIIPCYLIFCCLNFSGSSIITILYLRHICPFGWVVYTTVPLFTVNKQNLLSFYLQRFTATLTENEIFQLHFTINFLTFEYSLRDSSHSHLSEPKLMLKKSSYQPLNFIKNFSVNKNISKFNLSRYDIFSLFKLNLI